MDINTKKHNNILIFIALLLAFCCCIMFTGAWLNDTKSLGGVVTVGALDIQVTGNSTIDSTTTTTVLNNIGFEVPDIVLENEIVSQYLSINNTASNMTIYVRAMLVVYVNEVATDGVITLSTASGWTFNNGYYEYENAITDDSVITHITGYTFTSAVNTLPSGASVRMEYIVEAQMGDVNISPIWQ